MVLELGDIELYPCPLIDNLVRIGNISRDNPNHFWHALFSAFRPYREKTYKEQMMYLYEQRKRIAGDILIQDWLDYGHGFQSNRMIFDEFRTLFIKYDLKKYGKIGEIVTKIVADREGFIGKIRVKEFDTKVMGRILDQMTKTFDERLNDTEKIENRKLPMEKREKCIVAFRNLCENLWKIATEKAFQMFMDDMNNMELSIPFYLVPFMLGYLDFHVFFINSCGKDVLSINDHYENILSRPQEKCIIVLFDSTTQTYEPMGVVDPNDEDEQSRSVLLTRVFSVDDDVSQICYKRVGKCH